MTIVEDTRAITGGVDTHAGAGSCARQSARVTWLRGIRAGK
jgi:hypothetical protein